MRLHDGLRSSRFFSPLASPTPLRRKGSFFFFRRDVSRYSLDCRPYSGQVALVTRVPGSSAISEWVPSSYFFFSTYFLVRVPGPSDVFPPPKLPHTCRFSLVRLRLPLIDLRARLGFPQLTCWKMIGPTILYGSLSPCFSLLVPLCSLKG